MSAPESKPTPEQNTAQGEPVTDVSSSQSPQDLTDTVLHQLEQLGYIDAGLDI